MRICDICKDSKKPCFEVHIKSVKIIVDKSGKDKVKEMLDIAIDLCENDISEFHTRLGNLINKVKNDI